MRCPFCKTSTFRRVVAGERETDRCTACGALWFDRGEIRELTEGRLFRGPEGVPSPVPPGKPGGAEKPGALLSRMRRAGASLSCPLCEGALTAIDFQMTGIPVFQCPACEGILAPRASAAGIAARFRFLREHGSKFAALGETLAQREKHRMEKKYGPAGPGVPGGVPVPLPVVVPLADDAPAIGSLPVVTYAFIALGAALYLLGQVRGVRLPLPGGLPGLPAGTGFAGIPTLSLLLAPFLQAGILPLAIASLFLFVLGDNVEDRVGSVAYFFFYLFCGACAGAAHVVWGNAGSPPALGPAGAVAGILGAYLVFFPNVSIRMYGMGRILTIPAYLFACAWVIWAFFSGFQPGGPLTNLLDPTPLSLPGNLAGFGSGVAGAVVWRFHEGPGC
jgi:membrane associated rhomboid family serine protease